MSGFSSHGVGAAGWAVAPTVNAPSATAAVRILKIGIVISFSSSRRSGGLISNKSRTQISHQDEVAACRGMRASLCDFLRYAARLSFICRLETIWQENILRGRFG